MGDVVRLPRRRWTVLELYQRQPARWSGASIGAAIALEALLPPAERDWAQVLAALDVLVQAIEPGAARFPVETK
jgi:hypothetical protein